MCLRVMYRTSIANSRLLLLLLLGACTGTPDAVQYLLDSSSDGDAEQTSGSTGAADTSIHNDGDESADTSWPDPCPVQDNNTCSADCSPVLSVREDNFAPCTLDGVFLGCVRTGSQPPGDIDLVCAVLRSGPDHRAYCVEHEQDVAWYYYHLDLFCGSSPPCEYDALTICE